MGRPVTGINPDILVWARERAGQTVEDVALTIRKPPETVQAWERGESAPTYVQLEKLAYTVYKRPIAVFFFPEPPEEADPEGSFRTLPEFELENLSSDTRFRIRKARSLQLSLVELNGGINPAERQIFKDLRLEPRSSATLAARDVREYLGIRLQDQEAWRNVRTAMENWRAIIEDVGIYVFKDSFKQADVSGFCVLDDEFPVVYVNNGTAFSRQIFTLFHELAHILTGNAGITKQDDSFIDSLTGSSRDVEVFCNRFASEVLVPADDFDAQLPLPTYDDDTIKDLADRYLVSREVILRKLRDRNLVSERFYSEKTQGWIEEYRRLAKGKGGNYYATQATYLGDRFLKLAFSRYYQGSCSLENLADHLNVKASNVAGLEPFGLR